MCGIAGFNWQDRSLIKKMTISLRHRGPDDMGNYLDKQVSFGHTRLSILDLTKKGKQPMLFKHLVIIFNGEIYNFKDLRKKLRKEGHIFNTNTDTEVILHSYYKWGQNCLNYFNGMWAFCIYDKKKKILFLSRDRFGIKPLYYYFDDNKFIFASEIKAVRKHKLDLKINTKAVNFYFYQKYIGNCLTIFKNIYKLKPAENLTFDLRKRRIKKEKYYFLEKEILKCKEMLINERIKLVREVLIDAVRKRLIADVPVGSFLSGGIDSSLISAVIASKKKNFKTFSIGFKDDSFDEIKYSKLTSKYIKTKLNYQYFRINSGLIRHVLNHLDEPFGDPSILPTYLLSKLARQKTTVCLSGDGGDEVFGGYDTYLAYKLAKYIPFWLRRTGSFFVNYLPPSDKKVNFIFKVKRFVNNTDKNICRRHFNWMATFGDRDREKLLGNNFIKSKKLIPIKLKQSLSSMQLLDIHHYLPSDILTKVDTVSMLNSLEVRVPFLDHRLVSLVLSLPQDYKIKGLKTKFLLKNIAKNFIPKKIINRSKKGFTVPIARWIKENKWLAKYLTKEKYFGHNLMDRDYVQDLFKHHINNKEDNSRKLWLVFIFNYWWSQNKNTL